MITAIALLLGSVFFSSVELRAQRKRKKLKIARDIVYTDIRNIGNPKFDALKEAALYGVGGTALNLLDIYAQIDNHEEVLNVIEQRCPDAIGDASPMEWFKKIEELINKGSLGSYESLYSGQAAENIALELLRDKGYHAELFDTLNHPNDDILVTLNGTENAYSVKSGSVDYIKNCIKGHPESTHYIINTDAYDIMEKKGLIKEYADQGISILDGGYYNEELRNAGHQALTDIHDAGDFTDDIPVVALALFGVKTFRNIKNYHAGYQTKYELGVNVTTDIVRVGAGGCFAAGGAKIGSAIGTILAPGVGTIIGGGIGAIAGAFTGSSIFNWAKERIKWGKIIDAIDYFGTKYEKRFSTVFKNNLAEKYFNFSQLQRNLEEEEGLYRKFEPQLNPYSREKVTLPGIMCSEYLKELKATKERVTLAINRVDSEIYNICDEVSKKSFKDRDKQIKARKRYLGEILLSNPWLLEGENLSLTEREYISGYNSQIKLAENHPYKFNVKTSDILESVAIKSFNEAEVKFEVKDKNHGFLLYGISFMLFVLSIIMIIKEYNLFGKF